MEGKIVSFWQKPFLWFFLLLLILVVGGWFYFLRDKDNNEAVKKPMDVQITEDDNQKSILNRTDRYSLAVSSTWNVAYDDRSLQLNDMKNQEVGYSGVGGEGCLVEVTKTSILDLKGYAEKYCKENSDCKNFDINELTTDIYSLSFFGDFFGTGDKEYFLRQNKEVPFIRFTLNCSDETRETKELAKLLLSFKFLN